MSAVPCARREQVLRLDQCARRTPLIRVDHPGIDLRLKAEYLNLFGSSKDRSALWILRSALARGEVDERTAVVESSSGNFAIAMASLCRIAGIRFIPVIDPNCNTSTATYLSLACDLVERVQYPHAEDGYLGARLRRVQEVLAAAAPAFWPNQYSNADAVEAHYRMTGSELVEDAPDLDYVFVGAGTGGTIAGVSQRVKEHSPRTKVVAVDVVGSVIFGGRPGPRFIPGLGSSRRGALFDEAVIDDIVMVSELETVRACRKLLRLYGVHAGGSTGSVFAAIEQYFTTASLRRPKVAFISADRGTAYSSTVFNPDWVARTLGHLEPMTHDVAA